MEQKRVTLFAGHYGSGKTNIAVNYALKLAHEGRRVQIADLDIVNPYFRTKDSEELLRKAGVKMISSAYANTNLDVPALPQEMYAITCEHDCSFIVDVGGDDRGALALGRLAPDLLSEGNFEMIFVANCYRPLIREPQEAMEVMREIEQAGGIPFTALANNANLGEETCSQDVLASLPYMEELCRLSGLPVILTAAQRAVAQELEGKVPHLFPMDLQEKYYR